MGAQLQPFGCYSPTPWVLSCDLLGAQPQPLSRLEVAKADFSPPRLSQDGCGHKEVHYLAMDSARAMYLSCSTFGMSFQRTVQPQTRTCRFR